MKQLKAIWMNCKVIISGQSALYCASRNGQTGIMALLFEKPGLNLDIQVSPHNGTPLHGIEANNN